MEASGVGTTASGPATGDMLLTSGDTLIGGFSAWGGAWVYEDYEADTVNLTVQGCTVGNGGESSLEFYFVAGLYEGDLTSVPIVESFSSDVGSEVAGAMNDWDLVLGGASDFLPMDTGSGTFDDSVFLGTAVAGELRVAGEASYVLTFDLRW